MSYATLAEFKAAVFPSGISDSVDDTDIQRCLDAATAWIDSRTGRFFGVDGNDQTRVYYPTDEGLIDVVDLVSISSIKVDSRGDRSFAQALAAVDYQVWPPYGQGYGGYTRYSQIRAWPTSSKSFGPGRLVQIVGKWGFTENGVPPAIKQACLILANRYWKRHEAPFGILGSADMGQFERISKEDPDVMSLLSPYIRSSSWVAV